MWRSNEARHLLPLGMLREAAVTILEILPGETVGRSAYRIRYACCQAEVLVSHTKLHKRAARGRAQLAAGGVVPLCPECNRAAQAMRLKSGRRTTPSVSPKSHWPLRDALLGEIGPPPTWAVPPSVLQGRCARRGP